MHLTDTCSLFIGWDVGGWNCDANPKSRDALVVVDNNRRLVGKPWRGNLRETINRSHDTADFLGNVLSLCQIQAPAPNRRVLLAIDTPLGFSRPFIDLIVAGKSVDHVGTAATNPYLHRQTEHFLFRMGLSPLSPIKDMIGSQATKGMHVLSRFASIRVSCGVWTDGDSLTVIEAYPSACRTSQLMNELKGLGQSEALSTDNQAVVFSHADEADALICALTAWLFQWRPDCLAHPPPCIDPVEGWVFAPQDGFRNDTQ